MQVTIDYRERSKTPWTSAKHVYLDCMVLFSEEEKAIIQERGLYDWSISVPHATRIPTEFETFLPRIVQGIAVCVVAVSFFYGMLVEGIARVNTNYAGPAFFFGLLLFISAWVVSRKQSKRTYEPRRTITLSQLLSNSVFTVQQEYLLLAQQVEQDILSQLQRLTAALKANARLPGQANKRTHRTARI